MRESNLSPQERITHPLVVAFVLGRSFNRLAFHLEHHRLRVGKNNDVDALEACHEVRNYARQVAQGESFYKICSHINTFKDRCTGLRESDTIDEELFPESHIDSFSFNYEEYGDAAIGEILWYLDKASSWIDTLHQMFVTSLSHLHMTSFLFGETVDQGVRPRVTPARLRAAVLKEYRKKTLGSIPENPGDLPPDPDWWEKVCTQWNDLEVLGDLGDTVNILASSNSPESRLDAVDRFSTGIKARLGLWTPPGDPPPHDDDHACVDTDTYFKFGDFELDLTTKTVKFRGWQEVITHPVAFHIVKVIARGKGELVLTEEIRKQVKGAGGRIDQILGEHVPERVRALIPSNDGRIGGYALTLPPSPQQKVRNRARLRHK
jgi:hypothetical protein